MKRYDAYKDSGVQWIGEIPKHWGTRKIKYLFKERSEKGYPNEPILCATQKYGVIPQSLYENRVVVVNKGFEGLKLVKKGDFVISLRSFQGGIEYAYYQGIISAAYTILKSIGNMNSLYIKYLFKIHPFIELLKTCVTGIREGQNINYDILKNKYIILPPLSEQQSIVTYLKERTSKIDQYVTERERERELFESLKQSEIANVVTKGLNPNAPMKDSGIPWIGMIPEHWEVKKIRTCFQERREKVSDKDYPPLSVSKMGIIPQLDTAVKTDNGDNRKKVCQGDFVVNSRSDRKGSCGLSSYEGSVSLINIVLLPREVNGMYYHYLFRSNNYIEEFYRQGRGIVADLWTTRYSEMKNINIPVPPLSEQQAIVDYIDNKLQKIDQYITDLQSEIDYLKEFKQRLISDVVTGQICVAEPQKGEQQ